MADTPAPREGRSTSEAPSPQAPGGAGTASDLATLRRDIERWRSLAGADRGLLEALLHHIPHGIFVSDSGGRFVLQNRAAERIWAGSATLDSVQAWGVYRAYHPDGRPFAPEDWSMARCLTRREIVEAEEVHFQRFDDTHGILFGSCAPIFGANGELEGALGVFADITAIKHAEERLQLVTDALPVLIAYVDMDFRYRFANLHHERWFGKPRSAIDGHAMIDVLGDEAFAAAMPHFERALAGETAVVQMRMPHADGERFVEAVCLPHLSPNRAALGFIWVASDITERRRMEQERARWAERNEQLLRVTATLTGAVTPAQVLEAVVDGTAQVLHAAWGGLWLVEEDARGALLARSFDRPAADGRDVARQVEGSLAEVLESGEPVWTGGSGERLSLAILPLTVEGRRSGVLALAFEGARAPGDDDRSLLVVAARHAAQALERVRLLREAEVAYAEAEILYRLTDAVNRAGSVEQVYEASLETIHRALGVERASIHLLTPGGVPRFEAWRGLSREYREAAAEAPPWSAGAIDAAAVYVEDVGASDLPEPSRRALQKERIAAIAGVPLAYEGRLLGELRLYWEVRFELSAHEKSVAQSVADQVASAVGRKLALRERERLIEQLTQTVRLNELFAGVVGHDLRNPLSAIMTTAQHALRRDVDEQNGKRLARVLEAGERMTRMIEQLLDFTRARAGGGIAVDPQEAHLGELTRRIVRQLEDASPGRTILLEAEGSLEGAWDAERIAQVLTSLTHNALHHGAPGTCAIVHLDGRAPDEVVVRVTNVGALREELLPVLFEPFRSTKMRGERSRGLGMGLYIAQQIVLAHGGTIDVAANAGEHETTFTVKLPRRATARSASPKPRR